MFKLQLMVIIEIHSTVGTEHDSRGLFGRKQFGDGGMAGAQSFVCRRIRFGIGRWQRWGISSK